MGELFLGVDVGTGSVRAGLFDGAGRLVGVSKQSIRVWHESGGIVEQSSSDIWRACGEAIRGALASAKARPADVAVLASMPRAPWLSSTPRTTQQRVHPATICVT